MIIQGRAISSGRAEGELVVLNEDFSFLGGVDVSTGDLRVAEGNISGKIFAFRRGKGSTVGSYTIFDLKSKGLAPLGVVNQTAETIVTTGAVISDIPLVDGIDIDVLRTGDVLSMDGDAGTIELPRLGLREVVTGIVTRGDEALFLRRSDKEHHFPRKWGGVSGRIEEGETPEEAAKRELMEETSMEAELVRKGEPFLVRGDDLMWKVHPVLFSGDAEPTLNWEHCDHRWIKPSDITTLDTVPRMDEVLMRLGLIRP